MNTTIPQEHFLDINDFLQEAEPTTQEFLGEKQSSENFAVNSSQVIGIIDLGSNSARLLLVQVDENGGYNIVNRVKHMVRLGENAFETKMLQEPAMKRTLIVLHSFMDMCKKYEVAHMLPMATAAMRDALNAREFLYKVQEMTGLTLNIISGQEEARLICLGVSSSLPASLAMRTYIDIGGGSTEVAVANAQGNHCLDSLKLGCVRITNLFLKDYPDRVPTHIFSSMCTYIRSKASYAIGRMKQFDSTELIGSSGTALALHTIAHRLQFGSSPNSEQNTLSIEGLRHVCRHLCTLTAEERKALPGVSARRAEVLVAGAAILLTLMEDFNFSQISVSSRNLQDGILMDYLQRLREKNAQINQRNSPESKEHSVQERSVREHSVFQLAQRCQFEEEHSKHMAKLTLQLHDSAVDIGIMPLDHQARELLYYAAILHDIGIFIAYAKHANHGAYIINKTEMLGFTDEEIDFLATLVQMHNLKPNRKNYTPLPKAQDLRRHLQFFPLFLALAENMDRLHCQNIKETHFQRNNGKLFLMVCGNTTSPVEIEAVCSMDDLLQNTMREKVEIKFTTL